MPTTERKLRVFLCHASQDKTIVRELYQRFLAEGWIEPWLAEEKLLPGKQWALEIEKAVEAADAVIVFLSNNSVTKEGVVQKEIRRSLDKADEKPEDVIFIIPLLIEDCPVPRRLKSFHYQVYFDNPDLAFKRLCSSLESRASTLEINILELKEALQKESEEKAKRNRENSLLERIKALIRRDKANLEYKYVEEGDLENQFKRDNNFSANGIKILLVDDDLDWVELLKQFMELIDCKVDAVGSEEEMILKLRESEELKVPYSIVVTDVKFGYGKVNLGFNTSRNIFIYIQKYYPYIGSVLITGSRLDSEQVLNLRDDYGISYILEKDKINIGSLSRMIKAAGSKVK